ncbi:MAG: fatty acid desaturase [Lewinellaceae bacterium]|nr:fatty acid desaturase [Saprospiraceae bacterium]MCB9345724.1 fatty acid desaturase [Lewinellaceae bacterium]
MHHSFDQHLLLDRDTIRRLSEKSDFPALMKLSIQLVIFMACVGVLTVSSLPWYILTPVLLISGFVTFALYAPLHETTHETAFNTSILNKAGAWVTGIIYGYSPEMHKAFHFTHHRFTNQDADPEKGFSLPEMPGRTFFQIILAGILGMVVPLHSLILSLVPVKFWNRFEAAWTSGYDQRKLQWECRIVSVFWVAAIVFLAANPVVLTRFLIVLFLARFIHGFVTVSEHEGMADEGHMLYRTRSVVSNRIFRWFWWNMNFHAEHHTWPSVPFHQLPELHYLATEKHVHTENSYVRFFWEGRYRS